MPQNVSSSGVPEGKMTWGDTHVGVVTKWAWSVWAWSQCGRDQTVYHLDMVLTMSPIGGSGGPPPEKN